MTATVSQTETFLSEILPLSISNHNLMCFRLTPEIDRELGNRFAFRFSLKLPKVVTVWQEVFWLVGIKQLPSQNKLQEVLAEIQDELHNDIGDRDYSIEWIRQPSPTPLILAQLAVQILRINRPFASTSVLSQNLVEVVREVDFWAETVEWLLATLPAMTLTICSSIVPKCDLADFFNNHPYRHEPEQTLVVLKVQEIEHGNTCNIISITGTVGEQREELLALAQGSVSKRKLEEASADQPVVAVQFGKNKQRFRYPLAALRPCVTAETAEQFQVDYGELLKKTKVSNQERQNLLKSYKQIAQGTLIAYGFQLERSINSREYPNLFWQPATPIEQTPLLFGNGFTGVRGKILQGLSKGGVYRRHDDFSDESRSIRIAALKLCDFKLNPFLEETKQRLKQYKFASDIVNKKALELQNLAGASLRVEVEQAVNELIIVPCDVVLVFLPESDRTADRDESGSLYYQIYSQLLRRGIASQVIYADTLESVDSRNILNSVIPGILGKLGNLPFVLAQPLEIADYIIGLDVSRVSKAKLPGTLNACASIRLYGRQGEFIRYQLEDALIEGEEIPRRILESLLPVAELRNKTVLIYRDGLFRGQEVHNLVEWAKAISANFILVECLKSGNPRLYNFNKTNKTISAPIPGLALRLSSHEAIIVTTKVHSSVGLARPLRLRVHPQGCQVAIERIVETTLKLTLLHYGALKEPRLPMVLHGSDRIAYLRLNGINFSGVLTGDRQPWL
ncbi:stem cell self-renewal protein Piwi [Gloeocapsopsis crepidinum LEGE 06123]|uniref:Protein argonaute n=1 Tax=Gloeocapsopsis crepidinum LEGE 06123 TaxID=588587 RepID=A0ABR9UV39_9CHRO|nr:Piwi domain-containing protein [Gloeocapsopsis crepidinum]MBE9192157.1 stem cell self-renewal protein Piwi [Gloeocapsopsis crepidinum LEGE 06123]